MANVKEIREQMGYWERRLMMLQQATQNSNDHVSLASFD